MLGSCGDHNYDGFGDNDRNFASFFNLDVDYVSFLHHYHASPLAPSCIQEDWWTRWQWHSG